MGVDRKPYQLHHRFEQAVLYHLMLSHRFWGKIGHALHSECFSTELNQLVARAAMAVGGESGNGACSSNLVLQRIANWWREGTIAHKHVLAAEELVSELECLDDVPDLEGVVQELIPIIREGINLEAIRLAMQQASRREGMEDVVSLLQTASNLGKGHRTEEIDFKRDLYTSIASDGEGEHLPTGIPELDSALDGGPERKHLSVLMSGTGGGKSMGLCHFACHAMRLGLNVMVATLEVTPSKWMKRIAGNLSGVPIKDLKEQARLNEATRIIDSLALGECAIKYFTPRVTTVAEIVDWVKAHEKEAGWEADLYVIDYADLLAHSDKFKGFYEGMGEVYSTLKEEFAVNRNAWLWTASQSRRKAKGGERQGIDDGADSQNKARLADIWVVVDLSEDHSLVELRVVKNRDGDCADIPEMPTELWCGRLTPILQGREVADEHFGDVLF